MLFHSRVAFLAAVSAAGCGSGIITVPGGEPDGGGNGPPDAPDVADAPDGPDDGARADARPPADAATAQATRLRVINQCSQTIWIAHNDSPVGENVVRLDAGERHDYDIPAGGVGSVRFWPKLGCDASGHACRIGDTGEGGGAPCSGGCQPPIDSKFEISFAPAGSSDATFYNLSLVDGFTLPFTVRPLGAGAESGSCVTSDCSGLVADACPQHESFGAAPFTDVDLRAHDPTGGAVLGCMSPCKRWNYSAPFGLGHPEGQDPGLHMCCPTPFDPASGQCTSANGCISADDCRDTSSPLSVTRTGYVHAIHSLCPSAYSYSYDDVQGLHACPSATKFEVTFCP